MSNESAPGFRKFARFVHKNTNLCQAGLKVLRIPVEGFSFENTKNSQYDVTEMAMIQKFSFTQYAVVDIEGAVELAFPFFSTS